MAKFITIGYGDRAGYDRTPQPVKDAAHAQDAKLVADGALVDGSFMSSDLPIAGFAVIEAADLAEAIDKVSHVPCRRPWRRRGLAAEIAVQHC